MISLYDGIHYLNPLNYRFNVGDAEQKRRVLEDIDKVFQTYTDAELEMIANRKAKVSL